MNHDRGSVMAKLKAERDRLIADKDVTLKVPGYESLYARYRRLQWADVEPIIGLGSGDSTQDVSGCMDVLIDACEEFIFRGEDGDTPLGLKYEQGLAELLGESDCQTPAEVIGAVFVEEIDLMNHAGDYVAWFMRIRQQATEKAGNASGATN